MRLSPGPCCHLHAQCLPRGGRRAAHRDRPESERGSYFNLRNGALGRVCPRPTAPAARSAPPPKSLFACAESLSLIANPPLQWRGGGLPVAARRAESSKTRDKKQWPTKSFP